MVDSGCLGGLVVMMLTWNARDRGLIPYGGTEFFSPSEPTVTGIREFSHILMCFTHCWRGKLQNIEDPSLVILGNKLFPLTTSKLMGDNKEFDDSATF